MTRIPESIKVGAHTYRVVRVPQSKIENSLGICKPNELQIWIVTRIPRSIVRQTIWHETWHAAHFHVGIGAEDTCTPEFFIEHCDDTMLTILRENPELVAFLLET